MRPAALAPQLRSFTFRSHHRHEMRRGTLLPAHACSWSSCLWLRIFRFPELVGNVNYHSAPSTQYSECVTHPCCLSQGKGVSGFSGMAARIGVAHGFEAKPFGEDPRFSILEKTNLSSQRLWVLDNVSSNRVVLNCKVHSWIFNPASMSSQALATSATSTLLKQISWLPITNLSPVSLGFAEAQRLRLPRLNTFYSSAECYGDDERYTARTRNTADPELHPEVLDRKRAESGEETLTVGGSDGRNTMLENARSSAAIDVSSKSIHPSAVVHPDAIICEGVVIGPFCTVGADVKLGKGCVLHPSSHIHGKTELGERCVLHTGAVVGADIPGHTVIGKENSIGYYAVIGVECQDLKYKEGDCCDLYIGNNNDIREFASIHRSSKSSDETVIGNQNLIMGSCHIAHDCKLGNHNILANGTLLGGHVIVKDYVHTGGAVAVHQFCQIDSYSFIAAGSMVTRDVPMYMMVAGDRAELRGLNLEGLRRTGFSNEEVKSIRRAYQKLFMNTDPEAGGLEDRLAKLESSEQLIKVPAVVLMLKSVKNCFGEKRRGICNFRHWTCV